MSSSSCANKPKPPTTRYRPLLTIAISFGLGIGLDRRSLPVGWPHGYFFWSMGTAIALGLSLLTRMPGAVGRASGWWRVGNGLLLIATLCLGGLWSHLRWNYFPSNELGMFANHVARPVCIQGDVLARPVLRAAYADHPLRAMKSGPRSETLLEAVQIRDGLHWRSVSGKCKLRIADKMPPFQAGDRLLIYGQLSKLPSIKNPGQYDWQSRERSEGRICQLFCSTNDCVTIKQRGSGWGISSWLDHLRIWCQQVLRRYVGPQMGSLAAAILLGAREGLDPEVSTSYMQTGTVHLLVVSGLHVGILAGLLWSLSRWDWLAYRPSLLSTLKSWVRNNNGRPLQTTPNVSSPKASTRVLLTMAIVITYAVLVGSRPSVVRATVIVVLGLAAMSLGRKSSGINILSAAALVVLAWNPNELFRGGTQLSFVSVAALVAYAHNLTASRSHDPLQRLWLEAAPWYQRALRWVFISSWHVTIASALVWIITMPLVAYHFHLFAPIGILLSPIIWPMFTLGLVAGLGTLLWGWFPPVASLLGKGCALCLNGLQSSIQWAQKLEFGHGYVPGPPGWWLLLFYGGLVWFALHRNERTGFESGESSPHRFINKLTALKIVVMLLWTGCGIVFAFSRSSNRDSMHCTFLSMGHGTCVVMELPGGQTVLYDAGSIGSPELASRRVASFLWSRGITHLDTIVLSHADIDHYNGVPGLLDRFSVGCVYVSPHMFEQRPVDADDTIGPLSHPTQKATSGENGNLPNAPEYLQSLLQARGVPVFEVVQSDRVLTLDPRTTMKVLHPDSQGSIGRDNANSILLAVEYAGWRILLPGDLESPGLEAVISTPDYDCDVLLAPHHGSANSDPEGFASWSTPEWVVVSGQAPEGDSVVTRTYERHGAKVLCTSTQGAIGFVFTEEGVDMFSFLNTSSRGR